MMVSACKVVLQTTTCFSDWARCDEYDPPSFCRSIHVKANCSNCKSRGCRGARTKRGTDLGRQHDQGHADHDHHVELRGPDVGHEVAVAHRGKCHHDVVRGLEKVEVSMACPLKVLDSADAATIDSINFGSPFGLFVPETFTSRRARKIITNLNRNRKIRL
jgi:hypothetical protein